LSSSTINEDCQKNKYGVIVVPSTPTIVESHFESKWISGTTNLRSTYGQGGCTMNAVMM